jgi:patatin-like phospholipase/acyl hydrolase
VRSPITLKSVLNFSQALIRVAKECVLSRFSPGFAIFQGGGAKGTALAGALEVAETEFGCDFSLGVAGTSAGSIVAALYAARWSPTEILEELIELDLNTF